MKTTVHTTVQSGALILMAQIRGEHSGYDEWRSVRTQQPSTLTLVKCFSHISCSVCFYADDSVLFTQITAE